VNLLHTNIWIGVRVELIGIRTATGIATKNQQQEIESEQQENDQSNTFDGFWQTTNAESKSGELYGYLI
jgi:hypothetical protein